MNYVYGKLSNYLIGYPMKYVGRWFDTLWNVFCAHWSILLHYEMLWYPMKCFVTLCNILLDYEMFLYTMK